MAEYGPPAVHLSYRSDGVSQAAVQKNGVEWAKTNPVGTGPFTFVSLQRDTSLEFKRFDNYWDPGKPYLDGIKWTQVKDPLTQIAAFTAGEVDVLSSTDAKTLSDASKIEGATLSFEYDGVVIIYPDSANTDSRCPIPWCASYGLCH
jgi:peptide/nickel transport system substrate-binding protein